MYEATQRGASQVELLTGRVAALEEQLISPWWADTVHIVSDVFFMVIVVALFVDYVRSRRAVG